MRGNTSKMIEEFSRAFDRPVNSAPTTPSVTDRLLLGRLLLEETLEYIEKGLGLTLTVPALPARIEATSLELVHDEGRVYDPVEAADGLGDVNVIAHFNALWEGIPLDAVTREIHRSNMSKLDEDGNPILNECGLLEQCSDWHDEGECAHLPDTSKPANKILKGPNYSPPNLLPLLGIIPDEEEE